MKIITREQARDKGLEQYFTGEPCINGHISEREFDARTCSECNREYYEANKEKARKYYEDNKERARKYYEANKDEILAKARQKRAAKKAEG